MRSPIDILEIISKLEFKKLLISLGIFKIHVTYTKLRSLKIPFWSHVKMLAQVEWGLSCGHRSAGMYLNLETEKLKTSNPKECPQ